MKDRFGFALEERISHDICSHCSYGYRVPGHLLVHCGREDDPCPHEDDIRELQDNWPPEEEE